MNRDALPQAADLLITLEGVNTALVYGITDNAIVISARNRDIRLHLGNALSEAFGDMGDAGGHPNMAAATLPLHYFGKVEDKARLLEIVIEPVLKKFRDLSVSRTKGRRMASERSEQSGRLRKQGRTACYLCSLLNGSPTTGRLLSTSGSTVRRTRKQPGSSPRSLTGDNLLSLASLVDGNEVTVCGNAPCLKDEISKISGVVFAADAAAEVLDSHGICPDAIFTDLDGATDRFIELNNEGTIIVIHAHGDNMPLLKHWVPRFRGKVVGTTQAAPLPHVYNFGGFSDGDRAVFAADELGRLAYHARGF